jgi:hypothetical protein
VKADRLEAEFSGFSGGASGFGDPEFADIVRDEKVVPGTGMSVDALQSVVRRQLVGSLVVAFGVVVIAALVAMRPAQVEASASGHNFAVVQQPTFVTQHFAATKQHEIELP